MKAEVLRASRPDALRIPDEGLQAGVVVPSVAHSHLAQRWEINERLQVAVQNLCRAPGPEPLQVLEIR